MSCWVSFILILLLVTDNVISDECGRRSALPMLLINHGKQSRLGDWPWHVAVVQRMDQLKEKYACGGTIISASHILTAAHCTYPPTRERRLRPSELLIRAGISNLQQLEVYSLQQMEVAEITNHESFQTATAENDIALLKLDGKLNFTDYVKPICLWEDRADEELIIDKMGYVAGWGKDEHNKLPDQLKHAEMPIVSREKCRDSDSNFYTRYLFDRKTFCAGFRNGTSPGLGDSGGGLYIKVDSKWILRGIVSNGKFRTDIQKLDTSSFIVFSDVSYFLPWINSVTKPQSIKLTELDDCGQSIAFDVPASVYHGSQSRLGEWPWHVAVMHRMNRKSPIYACGGTIVASSYILTAAHCTDSPTKQPFEPSEIFIRTGITRLQWPENSQQEIDVAEIMIHEDFSNGQNDIALLKLDGQLTFTAYVKPICWWRDRADEALIVNKLGYIVGWGIDDSDDFSDNLKQEQLLIVSRWECRNSDPDFYTSILFDGKSFCGGFRNGSSLKAGLGGGGLYLEHKGRWTLRGILSSGKVNAETGKLDTSSFLVLTDVAQFVPWMINKGAGN